jgi:hypothetical protein
VTNEKGDHDSIISDIALLSYFSNYASTNPSLLSYLNNTLHALHFSSPSLSLSSSFCRSLAISSSTSSPIAPPISTSAIADDYQGQDEEDSNTPIQILPSLYIPAHEVISAMVDQPVLDAMKLMSEEGVSSVAVIDSSTSLHSGVEGGSGGVAGVGGGLVSAVSVSDIGKVWYCVFSRTHKSEPIS